MISVSNLLIGYPKESGNQVLFENLHLQLKAGELVCFMGPNGIGKSTLIRTLAGLQQPLAGEVSGVEQSKIAIVLTDKLAASNLTVYELVCYGRYPFLGWSLSLQQEDKDLVEEAISLVHLQSLVSKRLFELSDGQLQMALIAKALAQNTPVLLLDEPTAHLDLNNRVEIMNLLRTISRTKNKAVLVATHELDLALQTSDVIWLATSDKKIKSGIPEDLVLDGSFDDIFKFKGFDLKTGKVYHEPFRNISVNLLGDGYEYLWTKNALERNGFSISNDGEKSIIIENNPKLQWKVLSPHHEKALTSIQELMIALSN